MMEVEGHVVKHEICQEWGHEQNVKMVTYTDLDKAVIYEAGTAVTLSMLGTMAGRNVIGETVKFDLHDDDIGNKEDGVKDLGG